MKLETCLNQAVTHRAEQVAFLDLSQNASLCYEKILTVEFKLFRRWITMMKIHRHRRK